MYLESTSMQGDLGVETTADDTMEHCYWDEASRRRMGEPIVRNGNHTFDSRKTQMMIDFAWFENPHRPVRISIWDEIAKQKMRQPVRVNGYHHFTDESLKMLASVV